MFGITTQQQLPSEYITSYAIWDTYMASVWAALLLNQPMKPLMTVIEIAPGTSSKIGLALAKCQFHGKLYIVEPEKSSLSITYQSYKTMLPEADIYPIQQTLAKSLAQLPKYPDFLLANHPLDDMLIANPLNEEPEPLVFDWTLNRTSQLSPLFLEQCAKITSDLRFLTAAKNHIIQQWQHFFDELQPLTTIISQYPSIVLEENDQKALNQHAVEMLQTLKTIYTNRCTDSQVQSALDQLENYNNKYIGNEILNAKNWLMLNF